MAPTRHFENSMLRQGHRLVAGVDEVGRGPLAGPVVAAAVIFDTRRVPKGIDDSKALTPEQRTELFDKILACAEVGIAAVSAAEIDRINIRQASLLAMRRAISGLPRRPCVALVDGDDPPSLSCVTQAIVGGDARSLSIAAASIIAKVFRDALMRRLEASHPGYGFASHKGYSTKVHLDALTRLGPSPVHRMSFAPVRLAVGA
ncbi:MAG: ribonuclease HII [Hyphomicrobiales bacterium]|nr:ribonuclease HII [Hyphomicrobiales bacterium]MBV9053559.1 ribonuclease HII [Hyphomicrobiales bacterium]MBV9589994.1 ribonuclease HII [Hyphomicrobiales bacterium]MBV9753300.1 ribonuclease HII [Hyphomicrobiales bacterium]MBV9975799.1 ribonuclease HII [Hyphomicrobiales bacterium]